MLADIEQIKAEGYAAGLNVEGRPTYDIHCPYDGRTRAGKAWWDGFMAGDAERCAAKQQPVTEAVECAVNFGRRARDAKGGGVMLYRLKITGPVDVSDTRRRSDAALLRAERMAYDSLAGQGLLDTPAGWVSMEKVRAINPRIGGSAPVGRYVLFVTPSIDAMR